MKKTLMLVVPLFGLALMGEARSEEHHGEKNEGAHGGKKEEVKIPETFADAMATIENKRDAIANLIATGKLDKLHVEGEVIKKIADSLAKLASKEDSGVAKADLREVNLAAKALAATYGPLDEAGDDGKKEEAQKVFDEMKKLIETLKKFTKSNSTAIWTCPMHPDVTSGKPGGCPKCGMALVKK